MKALALASLLISLSLSFSAAARTTPTFGQSEVGVSCERLAHGTDFDTLTQCNNATGVDGVKQTAPIIIGTVTSPPYAATTCDANKAGMIQYTGSILQFCDGTSWNNLGTGTCTGVSAFSFSNQTNVQLSTEITSDAQTLSGFTCTASAVCSGCTILKNGTLQGTTANFVSGDQISIRVTSSTNPGTAVTASVYVGNTNSGTWSVTTTSDTCGGTPATGAVCSDGTIYAGLSPDGNVKMYTTRCDVGQTWDGSTCTGTASTKQWGPSVTTSVTSTVTGEINTDTLAALGDSYQAAYSCYDLVQNGQSDWYLPSTQELHVLYVGRTAIGGFNTSGTYWASRESSDTNAYYERFDGYQNNTLKSVNYLVRCVRK